MDLSLAVQGNYAKRELTEIRLEPAKAMIRFSETPEFRVMVGRAIQRACSLVGWTLKEFAAKCDRDPRQVARWMTGTERPHFDVLFSIEELRQPLVFALAEMSGVEVEHVVRLRRIG